MRSRVPWILTAVVCVAMIQSAWSRDTATGAAEVPPLSTLQGRWVRPDGGYVVVIRAIGSDGTLDAGYFNPSPLPFARALASRDDKTLRVFLELRAGGYDGSTYTLTYDPVRDVLAGVYFQAVAQQKYEIYFERVK